jgi:ATP-dependent 26S proteasome regulatory subunit
MATETTQKKMSVTDSSPMNIATISAGFEKGDFLVREEQGNRVYFDFFEEVRRRWLSFRAHEDYLSGFGNK